MLVFFKGKFINEEDAHVSINDRSFRFGDGVFETCLVVNGKLFDFAAHKKRFDAGLKFFKIKLSTSALKKNCEELVKRNKLKEGYIRIIASRGVNGPDAVGYLPAKHDSYFVIQSFSKPYPKFREIKLFISTIRAGNHTPSKINAALNYVMAMQEAKEAGCDNAIILDHDGNVCETASGNIFFVKGKTLYTPSTDLAFVPGTMRKKVIENWQGKVVEKKFKLKELFSADEIFMSNIGSVVASVTSVKPGVHKFEKNVETKKIRKILDDLIKN